MRPASWCDNSLLAWSAQPRVGPNGEDVSTGGSGGTLAPPASPGRSYSIDAAWHTGEGGQQRLTRPVCSPTSREAEARRLVLTPDGVVWLWPMLMLGRRPAGETA